MLILPILCIANDTDTGDPFPEIVWNLSLNSLSKKKKKQRKRNVRTDLKIISKSKLQALHKDGKMRRGVSLNRVTLTVSCTHTCPELLPWRDSISIF